MTIKSSLRDAGSFRKNIKLAQTAIARQQITSLCLYSAEIFQALGGLLPMRPVCLPHHQKIVQRWTEPLLPILNRMMTKVSEYTIPVRESMPEATEE